MDILSPTRGNNMSEDFKEKLLNQCQDIAENSLYNAQAHFFLAQSREGWRVKLICIPASFIAMAGIVAVVAPQFGWPNNWKIILDALIAFASTLTAVTAFLNYDKQSATHYQAANAFTMLRHEAKSLRDTFAIKMSEDELSAKVECLLQKYAYLIQSTEPTDEKSFQKAREQIQKGFHEMDYKKEDT